MVMLKSLDCGVVRLNYFWQLHLAFKMKNKLCSFVKIIMMNKTCKNHLTNCYIAIKA